MKDCLTQKNYGVPVKHMTQNVDLSICPDIHYTENQTGYLIPYEPVIDQPHCINFQFICNDLTCINSFYVCDGKKHCQNSEDKNESFCSFHHVTFLFG